MTNGIAKALAAASIIAMTAAACGGSSSSTPTTPTPPPTTGTPGETATITIGANGSITPTSVTITRGGRVTFVNLDNRAHDMSSDPHPEHSDCTQMQLVGFLSPGQSRTSGNFNDSRTCGFHDHGLPDDANLKGRIVVQ